jgi:hypothetical protein
MAVTLPRGNEENPEEEVMGALDSATLWHYFKK